MFVLQRGSYCAAKMEYSYGRRAQSTTYSLHWKDIAIIETELIEEAVTEAIAAIQDWAQQGYTGERWQIEGRGLQSAQYQEISPNPIADQSAQAIANSFVKVFPY